MSCSTQSPKENNKAPENGAFPKSELSPEIKLEKASFNKVHSFEYNGENETFSFERIQLKTDAEANTFEVSENGKTFGTIILDSIKYEGPGYQCYLYESNKRNEKILVLEATADIGIAWYAVAFLSKPRISNVFTIHEPRGSESQKLQQFLSVSAVGNNYTFQFKKKYLGRYSTIPKGANQDNNFIYLTKHVEL